MTTNYHTTHKLNDATEAFMNDLEGARFTMMRIAQIQAKLSACMDECLTEFRALFPQQGPAPAPLNQLNELPRFMQEQPQPPAVEGYTRPPTNVGPRY